MEENISLDILIQTLIHLLKPLTELGTQPDRMKRIKVRHLVNQLEKKEQCENVEALSTLLTLTLGEPSSPQSIQIPLLSEKDLYDTLLTSAMEQTSKLESSASSAPSTTITSTLSMGVLRQDSVDASIGFNAMGAGLFAPPGMPSPFHTATRSESIWYRAADGSSYSGQIDLGNAHCMLKKHLMIWDQANQRWRASHIWAEPLDDAGHMTCLNAFQKLTQTLPATTWTRKEAFKPKSSNHYSGFNNEWKPNGQRRYRPY